VAPPQAGQALGVQPTCAFGALRDLERIVERVRPDRVIVAMASRRGHGSGAAVAPRGRTHGATVMGATLFVLTVLALSGAPDPGAADARTAAVPREEMRGYRIGPEDVLQVSVWGNDAVSRTAPVRPDGKISLPLLNDVKAAGLTPMELREELIRRLAEYIPNPEVAVSVTEVRSFKVSVIGAVVKPGRYELKSWTTVIDLLAMAEGFTEFAARSRILVLRSDGQRVQRLPFDYDKVASGGAAHVNFYLRPADIVLVP